MPFDVALRAVARLSLLVGIAGCGRLPPSVPPSGTDYRLFEHPQRVVIRGYDNDAMEPFLTRDGRYVLFNNSNAPSVNTNLHYAERVDDTTFDYRGEIGGVNTPALDAVATMDRANHLYFVSTRSYEQTLSTIYRGDFSAGVVTRVAVVPGISRHARGRVNFDVEVSADGNTLYFVDGVFSGKPMPDSADLVMAARRDSGFVRLDPRLLANVNTPALEYAACISADELELFFTRVSGAGIAIYRSSRPDVSSPFEVAQRVAAIDGFAEAPTLSPDGRSLYYHRRDGDRFVIYRVSRP